MFGELQCSSVYESEAVGFSGDNFLNMVVVLETQQALPELIAQLKALEDSQGRDRSSAKFSARTLDVDILTYDDCLGVFDGVALPRQEITENAFVLWPLAEVAGDKVHPGLKRSFADLWQTYDKTKQRLWPIDFDFT